MRNIYTSLLLLFIFGTGYSQDLMYEVRGAYTRPVKKAVLDNATTMSDISPGYPSSWIKDYNSTEITTTGNGQVMKAAGTNEILTEEQRNIIQIADLGSDIVVNISYQYENSATLKMDTRHMNFKMTVVPEKEAEYSAGYDQLIKYLEDNAIHKITEKSSQPFPSMIVRFTVNEKGDIDNAFISQSSNDPEIDKIFLKAIHKMPKWKPAENAQGIKVKQDFEFSIGNGGC